MKITTKDLINYYINGLERKGQIKNNFEKQNEFSYWSRIRKHHHMFITTNDKSNNPEGKDIYCIGCALSNIYLNFSDDFAIIMQELYQEAKRTGNYNLISSIPLDYEEASAIYEIYSPYKTESEISKEIVLSLTKKKTK